MNYISKKIILASLLGITNVNAAITFSGWQEAAAVAGCALFGYMVVCAHQQDCAEAFGQGLGLGARLNPLIAEAIEKVIQARSNNHRL